MLLYSLKTKNIEGNLKLFHKRESIGSYALEKWGSTLNTCVHAHGNNVDFFHEDYHKNNCPLVQLHCIIKIMCQDLPLGCLHCLLVCAVQNRNFSCSARFYIFYWNVKWVWNFFHCLYVHFFIFPNFGRIFGVPEVW